MPVAERLDQEPMLLGQALQGLGDRHLLGLRVPVRWGGAGFTAREYGAAMVEMAAASGILAFLQTQHQSAAAQIARFGSATQQAWLPAMVRGDRLMGVGFSHLRRSGEPLLRAMPRGDGFVLTGVIPWITGYGFFPQAIAGATLPNGDELYAMIPLATTTQSTGGSLDCGEPLPLAAMGHGRTVTVTLQNWLLMPEDCLTIKPAGSIHQGDRQNVLHHACFALGCAKGSLHFLRANDCPDRHRLERFWQRLNDAIFAALDPDSPLEFAAKVQLRLQAIATAQHYAQIALTLAGGAGNLLTHPAQRLYREALMFSVFGQTPTIRNLHLNLLLQQKPSGYTGLPDHADVVQW